MQPTWEQKTMACGNSSGFWALLKWIVGDCSNGVVRFEGPPIVIEGTNRKSRICGVDLQWDFILVACAFMYQHSERLAPIKFMPRSGARPNMGCTRLYFACFPLCIQRSLDTTVEHGQGVLLPNCSWRPSVQGRWGPGSDTVPGLASRMGRSGAVAWRLPWVLAGGISMGCLDSKRTWKCGNFNPGCFCSVNIMLAS